MNAQQPGSAYVIEERREELGKHTLAVLVDNEPGVLARVIGLFSGRGYNIESLTVSETEHEKHLSRITIVTSSTLSVVEQIIHQLERLVPVHSVINISATEDQVERELCLVKVRGTGENRLEALRLAQAFNAKTVDVTLESFVFELSGRTVEIDRFINVMTAVGLIEAARTGVVAMTRGEEGMRE